MTMKGQQLVQANQWLAVDVGNGAAFFVHADQEVNGGEGYGAVMVGVDDLLIDWSSVFWQHFTIGKLYACT